ncbi:MAG: potassium transporter TrkA [Bacteroidetes bacterium CG12_big_fil_rev_8_21_14_0_65_60_17]|nr:MAG: potassium transporter TrkA [Bacteroidetes bacterium CG12_big_fil_rev_8_21_14_0_65_60_17]
MKTLSTQLSFFLHDVEMRQNVRLLLKYVLVLLLVIALFTVLFHVIMFRVEGKEHSWITGLYWTLTVMSTLGFGDITFESDTGRLFSVIVLVTGIIMLLIVLPFAFIRFFYAPWLEAQIHSRAPRELSARTSGHVILTARDAMTDGLTARFARDGIPYILIEENAGTASDWVSEGLATAVGEVDNRETYVRLRADQARLLVAARSDMVNTNITLTAREVAPNVPIAAITSNHDAVDILELSGANHVLPLKRWLGEQLSNRINAQSAGLYPIGVFEDLRVADLPVHNTPLVNKTIRETQLRNVTGVSIVGVWERGQLVAALPDKKLSGHHVLVVVGTDEQLSELDDMLVIYDVNPNAILLIGGGTVGAAAAHALKKKGVAVHLVERDARRCQLLHGTCDKVFHGDASDYDLLQEAGIAEAPSVLLTTNDDAINVYLASYCRRLNPELRIVSRITHERNLDAIYRAGADFVLSYSTLGLDVIMSILNKRDLIVLGEGVDLMSRQTPPSLVGKSLVESDIGARTGLNVIAIKSNGDTKTAPRGDAILTPESELVMIGTDEQSEAFSKLFA